MALDFHLDYVKHSFMSLDRRNGIIVAVMACVILSTLFCVLLLDDSTESVVSFQFKTRVNPNTASVVSLARLPLIGQIKAQAIVDYRKNAAGLNNHVFTCCQDMQKVKGVGIKTTESICKWLKFE